MASDELNGLLKQMNSANVFGDDDEDELPDDVKAVRTHKLNALLEHARGLEGARPEEFEKLVQKLATGSRDASWRIPIGHSGALQYFLGLLGQPKSRSTLNIEILRLVGNSCADTDENRARVVDGDHLPTILRLLDQDELVPFVIPCLHNICIDYDRAQSKAAEAGISKALVAWLESPRVAKAPHLVGIVAKTLALVANTDHEKSSLDLAAPIAVLRLAASSPAWPTPESPLDIEDFCSLVSAAAAYLTQERIASASESAADTAVIIKCLEAAYTRFSCSDASDPDDATQLINARKSLVAVVADLSSQPGWTASFPATPDSHDATRWLAQRGLVKDWLSNHHSVLQEAACLVFGNLASDDAKSSWLVQTMRVHEPVLALLRDQYPYSAGPDDVSPGVALHSAVGLLKNLAIPPANKPTLGERLVSDTRPAATTDDGAPSGLLPYLWAHGDTQPQTQLAIVSLCRLLLAGCPANAERLCSPLPGSAKTQFDALADLFATAPTEPTKTEAARVALALCRALTNVVAAGDAEDNDDKAADAAAPPFPHAADVLAHHPALPAMLSFLLVQTRFPVLRSEAWFVLGLMSRRRRSRGGGGAADDAAVVAARTLTSSDDTLEVVARAVKGPAEPSSLSSSSSPAPASALPVTADAGPVEAKQVGQAADPMAKIDRENILVLLVELLKNESAVTVLTPEHKARLEGLRDAAGDVVVQDRDSSPTLAAAMA